MDDFDRVDLVYIRVFGKIQIFEYFWGLLKFALLKFFLDFWLVWYLGKYWKVLLMLVNLFVNLGNFIYIIDHIWYFVIFNTLSSKPTIAYFLIYNRITTHNLFIKILKNHVQENKIN